MEKLDIFDFKNEEFEAQKLMRIANPEESGDCFYVEKDLKRITTAEIKSSINSFYKMNDLEK